MLFDVSFTSASGSPGQVCELASLSEKMGFHSVWMAHDLLWDNAWVVCGAIARSTTRIFVGPGIVNPYSSTPAEIAMAAATLDNISGGRCILGIGPGARLMLQEGGIEQTHVIRTLGKAIGYLKDTLSPDSTSLHVPTSHRIPIYVGCQSPKLLEHVGMWQVGALPLLTPPSYASNAIQAIKKGEKKAGVGVANVDLIASFLVSISKDEEESRRSFARFIMAILPHLSQSQLREAGVLLSDIPDLHKVYSEKGWEGLPDRVFRLGITDVESCIRSIEEARRVGFGRVKFGSPLGPNKEEAIRILADEVTPHFAG